MDYSVSISYTDLKGDYDNVSKLPFLQLSGSFRYLECEFKKSGETIGIVYFNDGGEKFRFCGYGLLDEFVGMGLGAEMLEAVLREVGFRFGVDEFFSYKMMCNRYSHDLMKKLGLRGRIKIEETESEYILRE